MLILITFACNHSIRPLIIKIVFQKGVFINTLTECICCYYWSIWGGKGGGVKKVSAEEKGGKKSVDAPTDKFSNPPSQYLWTVPNNKRNWGGIQAWVSSWFFRNSCKFQSVSLYKSIGNSWFSCFFLLFPAFLSMSILMPGGIINEMWQAVFNTNYWDTHPLYDYDTHLLWKREHQWCSVIFI